MTQSPPDALLGSSLVSQGLPHEVAANGQVPGGPAGSVLPEEALLIPEGHFVATEFPVWNSSESDRRYYPQRSSRDAVAEVDLLGFTDPLGALSPGAATQGEDCQQDETYESLI